MPAYRNAQMLQRSRRRADPGSRSGPARRYPNSYPVSIYGFTFSEVWIQDANGDKNFVMIFVIIADILVIITAALGLYGIKKANSCLLFLFTILVGIFFVVLLAAGILAALAPNTMLNDDLCTGSGNLTQSDQWIADVNTLYNQTKLFCQPLCNCNLTDLSNYTAPDRIALLSFVGRNVNGTLQAQSCAAFNSSVSLFGRPAALAYISALGTIEEYFSCTGWCVQAFPNDNLFYKFSNVQAGKPKGYCYW